jgi:hypothetical protein
MAVADAKLEELKDTPYANVVSEAPTPVVAGNLPGSSTGSLKFTRQVTVTANSPLPTAKTVRVTVTWTEGSRSYSVPVSTVISQP